MESTSANRQNILNKPDIIICDNNNKKRTCMLIDVSISRDRNVIKREAEKISEYKLQKQGACGMVKNKSNTNNNRGNWDHFKTIQKISEQHRRKEQNQRTIKKKSHIGHCTPFSESTYVRAHNIGKGK